MSSASTKKYLLDTNVLIEAHKKCYSPDLTMTFWKRLARQSQIGTVRSIDKVRNEIDTKNKFLTTWAANNFAQWENTRNNDTLNQYRELLKWSTEHPQFNASAKSKFARTDNADPWLVAHAIATKCTVVTEEVYNFDIKKDIPVPNVCKQFNVPYMNTFTMLRELNINLD